MKIEEAILKAKKHKCKLKSKSLAMYEQTAKTLLNWLIVDDWQDSHKTLDDYLKADDWELDIPEKNYHIKYVLGCTPKLKSFETIEARNKFLNKFKAKYGIDDGGDNFIELIFDGKIKFKYE